MTATVLMLFIFEANTAGMEDIYIEIENYLMVQVFILVFDLLFFLFKEARRDRRHLHYHYDTFSARLRSASLADILTNIISFSLYMFQIVWIIYGNDIYFRLPQDQVRTDLSYI